MNRLLALSGLALLLAMVSAGNPLVADEPPEARLEAVNQAISDIENWLAQASNTLSEQEQSLRQLGRDISTREQRIQVNRQLISNLSVELQQLEQREGALNLDIASQQAQMAKAVRAAWMSGQDSALKLLLDQQDPVQIQRMMLYYDRVNAAQMAQINRYRNSLADLNDTRAAIAANRSDLEQHNATLERELDALAADRDRRQALISELESDMAGRSDTLLELQQDREHLEALIEEINRIIVDIPPPEQLLPIAEARGQLPWPLDGPALNRFGDTYSSGNMIRQGIIIGAEAGTPVRAVHNGRVVFADWLRGSGLLVVVDHGDGYISLYAHNEALNKQTGDWVNRAEPVATAGSNAGMDSAGVYFELRHNGTPVDPVQWLISR